MILSGEKKLLTLQELRPIAVPTLPELSVKAMYSEFAKRDAVATYLPPKLAKGKSLDKQYFWNVVSTVSPGEV